MTSRLFVYGTLRPGEPRWRILEPLVTGDAPEPATAGGRLFATPYGWPAAVFDAGAPAVIPGLALTLRDPAAALPALDEVEGTSTGLFERRLTATTAGECWAYHWPGPTAAFRAISRWPDDAGKGLADYGHQHGAGRRVGPL